MKKIWKTVNQFNFSNIEECIVELNSKNYVAADFFKKPKRTAEFSV